MYNQYLKVARLLSIKLNFMLGRSHSMLIEAATIDAVRRYFLFTKIIVQITTVIFIRLKL